MGVQLCGRRVVCGLCRASILAGLALMQATVLMGGGYLKKVRDNIMESPISSKKLTRFDTMRIFMKGDHSITSIEIG